MLTEYHQHSSLPMTLKCGPPAPSPQPWLLARGDNEQRKERWNQHRESRVGPAALTWWWGQVGCPGGGGSLNPPHGTAGRSQPSPPLATQLCGAAGALTLGGDQRDSLPRPHHPSAPMGRARPGHSPHNRTAEMRQGHRRPWSREMAKESLEPRLACLL